MIQIYQTEDFLILDNFLAPKDFQHIWNFFQEEEFQMVHEKKWIKAFQLTDGQPLWGSVYLSHANPLDSTSSVYPCKRGIDVLIKAMLDQKTLLEKYCGVFQKDWERFFCRPYLYPAGSGLSWHTDGRGDVAGAYVYYAHQEWNPQWGAELLVDSMGTRGLDYPQIEMYNGEKKKLGLHLNHEPANQAVMEYGFGHYIMPKPNRFVALKPGVLHRIKRVDATAGSHIRASVTGFFLKK